MQISVILTTHNRSTLLSEAIASVLAQTRPADEIIVIDDGSSDDTAQRLEPLRDRIHYQWQPQKGVAAARNLGISLARGEWFCFLDSDDLWKPKKLARQAEALSENQNFFICYTDEEWRRGGRWMNQRARHRKHSGWIYRECLPLCIISPSSVMIHRDVLQRTGLFDESLPACEDYDLWLRIACLYPVLFLSEALIVKRAGDWPQLSAQHSLDRYRIIALEKMLRNPELGGADRSATAQMLLSKVSIFAQGCRKRGRDDEALWAEETAKKHHK